MREHRGTVYVGGDSRISMGDGTRLPKESAGGGGKGSGDKGKKAGDVELPFGSGKANTAPRV